MTKYKTVTLLYNVLSSLSIALAVINEIKFHVRERELRTILYMTGIRAFLSLLLVISMILLFFLSSSF